MNRFRIGAVMLLVLLAAGLWAQSRTARMAAPVTQALERAQHSALDGDWETADAMASAAFQRWQDSWRQTAALADHQPMEDIDGLMAQLPVYAAGREPLEFAALCADLSRRVTAVADAHALHWWNIL